MLTKHDGPWIRVANIARHYSEPIRGANPRARAAVDCGEMDQGDVKEQIVLGNVCGGKPGSHESKVILLSCV